MTEATTASMSRDLVFVTAASNWKVLESQLLRSDDLRSGQYALIVHWNTKSAAEALNSVIDGHPARWVVWVHQDVFLPPGWAQSFLTNIATASKCIDRVAVAGVYGTYAGTAGIGRAGNVLDRGRILREPIALPVQACGLDEMLFAVDTNSGLRLDPSLGFDFYATDLVLQARQAGYSAVIVDSHCEHWSNTPNRPPFPEKLCRRIADSGMAFENKWIDQFPIHTPLLTIHKRGDTLRFIEHLISQSSV